MTRHQAESPEAAIRTLRLIGIALATGVTLFGAVSWVLLRGALAPPAEDPMLLYLWIALGTTMAAAAMVVWRGQVVPHLSRTGEAGDWRERAARIQTGAIITWSLVEMAALLGVVVYFLDGHALAGGGGVLLMWAALALTWPRMEWLQPERAPGRTPGRETR